MHQGVGLRERQRWGHTRHAQGTSQCLENVRHPKPFHGWRGETCLAFVPWVIVDACLPSLFLAAGEGPRVTTAKTMRDGERMDGRRCSFGTLLVYCFMLSASFLYGGSKHPNYSGDLHGIPSGCAS